MTLNIGWVSASPAATTGYGTQTMEICDRLLDRHNVTCIGQTGNVVVWGGRQTIPTPTGKNLTVLPLADPRSAASIINGYYIPEFEMDIVVGFMDAFGLEYLNELNVPVVGWIPIDGPFTEDWAYYVRKFHRVVAYSRFGYNELLKFFPPSRIDFVPHGIPDDFKPLKSKETRERLATEYGIPEDSFLTFHLGANVGPRKQIPLMMKTFSRFVNSGHDAHLYIHTNANQRSPRGYDLLKWRRYIGMEKNIHFPYRDTVFNPVSNHELALLHNAADLYWSNSVAEGFGLPIAEAMACGTAIMVPDNSAQTEFLDFEHKSVEERSFGKQYDRGLLIDSVAGEIHEEIPVYVPQLPIYPVPDQASSLEALVYAYNHRDVLKKMGKNTQKYIEKYHRWDSVASEWFRVLHDVEKEIGIFKEVTRMMVA